jgi:hypothetical protein
MKPEKINMVFLVTAVFPPRFQKQYTARFQHIPMLGLPHIKPAFIHHDYLPGINGPGMMLVVRVVPYPFSGLGQPKPRSRIGPELI